VAATNRALKAAVERIVLNLETGCLELHRRDNDAVSQLPVWSRAHNGLQREKAPQTS
jgi:hypothetical protein